MKNTKKLFNSNCLNLDLLIVTDLCNYVKGGMNVIFNGLKQGKNQLSLLLFLSSRRIPASLNNTNNIFLKTYELFIQLFDPILQKRQ